MHRISSRVPMSASSSSAAGAAPPSAAAATSSAGSTPAAASSSSSSSFVVAVVHPKKTKASTSSSPSTAPVSWLLLLPDITRDLLCSYLEKKDVSHLSVGSKCLLDEYGTRWKSLIMLWRYVDDRPLSSLLSFTARQKGLYNVELGSDRFLPFVFISLGAGHFRHLQMLELRDIRLLVSISSTIAAMIANDTMPLLEHLCIKESICEKAATKAILQGLQKGACPRLVTLDLPYAFHPHTVDEDGDWVELEQPEAEETESNFDALADVLEERQRLGTCQNMEYVGDYWLDLGRAETQARLLRLLLPVVEELPETWANFSWKPVHALAFHEVPAPHLQELRIPSYAYSHLLDSLTTMTSLGVLKISNGAFDSASFYHFVSLIKDHNDNASFLPKLQELYFASAIMNTENGDIGFARLFQALRGSACAKSLQEILIEGCHMSADGANGLAALIENGDVPSLRNLTLRGNGIGSAGVIRLMTSCQAAGPSLRLTTLTISIEGMNDEGLRAFASALKAGALRHLQYPTFSRHEHITDAGAMHLVDAIKKSKTPSKVRELNLTGTNITSEGAASLAGALLQRCPKLELLGLPASIHDGVRAVIRAFFRGNRSVRVLFG